MQTNARLSPGSTGATHLTRQKRGFTLTEILVTICIIGVLGVICVNVSNKLKKSGNTVREMGAARSMVAALMMATEEKNGILPYGYDSTVSSVDITGSGFRGTAVHGEASHRYTWRLAPYFGFKFDGNTVIDRSMRKLITDKNPYMLSLMPALGINAHKVGGFMAPGETKPAEGTIRRMSDAYAPEKTIAFISARTSGDDEYGTDGIAPGFHAVTPPITQGGDWSKEYDPKRPSSWGNVDLRHNHKAVVGFLDGSVGTLGMEQLNDMRHWDNEAARSNDKSRRPITTLPGGGRRDR